jgi:hypothetical protein
MVGADKKMATQALEKKKLLDLVQALDSKRKEYVGTLKESDGLKDEQIDEAAYQKLIDAQNNLPSDADREKILQEASWLTFDTDFYAKVKDRFDGIMAEKKKEKEFKNLLAKATEEADPLKSAPLAEAACALRPQSQEAAKLLASIKSKLSDEQNRDRAKKKDQENKQNFAAALGEAKNLVDTDPDKALVELKKALDIYPADATANELQGKAQTNIETRRKKAEATKAIDIASSMLDSAEKDLDERVVDGAKLSLDSAEQKVAEAKKLNAADQKIAELDKRLADARKKSKEINDYNKYVGDARTALGNNDTDGAEKAYKAAQAIDPNGPGLKEIGKSLGKKLDEKAEREARQKRVEKALAEADNSEKQGDSLAEDKYKEKISAYQGALDLVDKAKPDVVDNDPKVGQKARALGEKIKAVKDKFAAAMKAVRDDAIGKASVNYTDADAAAKAGDFKTAFSKLEAARAILADTTLFANEIKAHEAKVAEFRSRETEFKFAGELKQISNKALQGVGPALDEVKNAKALYPQYSAQLGDIESALATLSSVDNKAQSAISDAEQKFRSLDAKAAKGKGDRERQAYTSARDAMKLLVPNAVATLVKANFANYSSVTKPLSNQAQDAAKDLSNKLNDFERATKDTPPPPPIDHGNEHNIDSSRRPPPEVKKPSTTRVGEGDLDN